MESESCEECLGAGRWPGTLGMVECWRCYGTGKENPTREERIKAKKYWESDEYTESEPS